jgi:thioester reductase-like protein
VNFKERSMAIAITGATGLLGTRPLEILAERTDSLILLSRSGGAPAGDRIVRYLRASGRPESVIDSISAKIRSVPVELDRPLLGLSAERFQSLADQLDEIWHSAASIDLNANLRELNRINTVGTRRVLDLVSAGTRNPMLHHVSSIGVVGRIYEDDLDDSYGFTTRYEESKYLAEIAVREWSARTGRPAIVYRPSVLITDQLAHPDLPTHPLLTGMQLTRTLVTAFAEGSMARPGGERLVVRIPGAEQAAVNMPPVDEAARLMVAVADHGHSGKVDTYHIVHPKDVRMSLLAEVFQELFDGLLPVSWRFVPSAPKSPTPWETLVYQTMGTFLPFISYQRRFDDKRLRELGLTGVHTPPVDRDYLMRGLSSPVPVTPVQRGTKVDALVGQPE